MLRTFAFLASLAAPLAAGDLFRDDFSRYPVGILSAPIGQLNGAIQEYHYIAHRGVPLAPWRNPIVHEDAWAAGNPKPKLWKKFDTPGYGAGRNVRFGDLDGDGRVEMLIAQNVPKVRGDAYDTISCLTGRYARRQNSLAARKAEPEEHAVDQRHPVSDTRS